MFKAEHGLPQTALKDVFQDSKGYIWIASQEGLARFDGVRFERFDRATHGGLGADFVWQIAEDWNGHLWFGTQGGGISRFDGENFVAYNTSNTPGLESNAINKIEITKKRKLWIGWDWGVATLEDGTFRTYARPSELIPERHGEIFSVRNGDDWLLMRGDSVLFRHEATEWAPLAMCLRRSGEIVLSNGKGELYGLMHDSLYRFAPSQLPASRNIREMFEDKDGNLWFVTNDNGIIRWFEGRVETFNGENGLPVNNNFFLRGMEDREGNLWFVGDGGLVELYDTDVINFGKEEELKSTFGHSVCQDSKGNMWAALRNSGIAMFSKDTTLSFTTAKGLHTNDVTIVCPAPDGGLWIGTAQNGLMYMDDEQIKRVEKSGWYSSLYVDRAGHLWLGLNYGAVCNRNGKKHIRYVLDSTLMEGADAGNIVSIIERANGEMWFGTYKRGLFKMVGGSIARIGEVGVEEGINALYEDAEHVLWIATDGNGLYRYRNGEYKNITSRNGLYFDRLFTILEDDQHNLWFSGNRGIFKVSKRELNDVADGKISSVTCRAYSKLDGMRETECNGRRQPSAWKSRDGKLWFCSIGGIVSIDPNKQVINRVIPPVYVEGMVANGDQRTEPNNRVLSLGSDQRSLSFQYTALSFTVPERVRFRYRLDGFDNDWVDAGTRRSAFYTNVPKGNYTFRVIACNNDGVWNNEGASVQLSIAPFWWETWWAYGAYVLIGGFVLYSIRSYEMKRIRLRNALKLQQVQNEQLRQMDHIRSRFFAGISHEFRTPLTLIAGPLEDLMRGEREKGRKSNMELMLRNTRRLERLVDQLLDLAQLESGKLQLEAKPVAIAEFLRGIVASFESQAKGKNVQLELQTEALPANLRVFLDADKMEKVLVNLLSNAIKYTPYGGEVRLSGSVSSDAVEIRLRDTGIGIPPQALLHVFDYFYRHLDSNTRKQSGTGIGLALAKELVELHHGGIHVESAEGSGTTFILRLPLGKAHLKPEEIESEVFESVEVAPKVFDLSPTEESAQPSPKDPDLPTVLLVEDNADMRAFLRSHLAQEANILEARDGDEALRVAAEDIPDVIVSDVMMPEMDGFEMCRQLKSGELTNHIPVILLTARGSGESKMQGLELGADEYLTKPVKGVELRLRVKNLLERQMKLREHLLGSITRPATASPALPQKLNPFLQKAITAVEAHLADAEFGPEELAHVIAVSRAHLNRKLHGLIGQRTVEFIRTIRLKHAAELLRQGGLNVSEVAGRVGFNHLSYFARCFKDQYGQTPSEFSSGTA